MNQDLRRRLSLLAATWLALGLCPRVSARPADGKKTEAATSAATSRNSSEKAHDSSGQLRGVIRNQSGQAMSGAQVSLRSPVENTDRATLSGDDGGFAFENLNPGQYELTANKMGFANSTVIAVELAAGRCLQVEMTLGASISAAPPPKPASMTESEKYLLAEMERLNLRLAELEARLAGKQGNNASTEMSSATSAAPVPALHEPAAPLTVAAWPAERKKPKAEPFAFADFT